MFLLFPNYKLVSQNLLLASLISKSLDLLTTNKVGEFHQQIAKEQFRREMYLILREIKPK